MNKAKLRRLVLYAMFTALIFILALTPLGYINAGAIELTLIHIPVIIGAIMLGVRGGALLGFFFGLSSLLRAFMVPTPLALMLLGTDMGFGIYNLVMIIVILFIPRILVGVFSALIYEALSKKDDKRILALSVASVGGSLTNTVLFLGFLFILARDLLAVVFGVEAAQVASLLFTATGLINGGIEAAAAAIICTAVCKALMHYGNNTRTNRTDD